MSSLSIAKGKRLWERARGVARRWAVVVQASKAFWMGERDWFLLRVFCAGVSSSSGGAACVLHWASSRGERRGVVAWATLGAGATLGGVRRGGVLVGNGENVAGGRGLGNLNPL